MKIRKKSKKEFKLLREGGKILAESLSVASAVAKEATSRRVTTKELDVAAEEVIRKHRGEPAFLNYRMGRKLVFPAALCTSINDEIVHGVPSEKVVIKEGDLISLDVGVKYKGLFTDAAVTLGIGQVSNRAKKLMWTTKDSLEAGLEVLKPGATLGDYGSAVDKTAVDNGFVTVRGLVGHGVGYDVHEDPQIPNFGFRGDGLELEEGMVLAFEPMLAEHSRDIIQSDNRITYMTEKGDLAAHFEHTVAITEDGYEIMTLPK